MPTLLRRRVEIRGIAQEDAQPDAFDVGFERAMVAPMSLLLFGALVAAVAISNDTLEIEPHGDPTTHCGVGHPPARVTRPETGRHQGRDGAK